MQDDPVSKEVEASFDDLGLSEPLMRAIAEADFTKPSEIQRRAIPPILSGQPLIGQARTGSGKTAAFVLPILEKMNFDKTVEVLVLVPTRELAKQVVQEFRALGKYREVQVVAVVGGDSPNRQIELINRGAQVVVATPGRLLDHLRQKKLKRFTPKTLVMDEADEMLDMGFIDDIQKIIKHLPTERQSLLFSATMPPPIVRLAHKELKGAMHIKLEGSQDPTADVEQSLYVMQDSYREPALLRLIEMEQPEKALVFCRTRWETDQLTKKLVQRGHTAQAIHGDMMQTARERAMRSIKKGETTFLVATDVASRGIDISELTHVFNYHVPENKHRYTHRIGRTGRAGRKGKALTLASPQELQTHVLFKQHPARFFNVKAVPSHRDVQRQRAECLAQEIQLAEVCESAAYLADLLSSMDDPRDLVPRLASYLLKGEGPLGPNTIGLSPGEVKKLLERKEPRRTDRARPGKENRRRGGKKPRPFQGKKFSKSSSRSRPGAFAPKRRFDRQENRAT